jgi:hypothetical protein
MRIPVRNREMNPAFGLPTVEILVQAVERCPTRIDCFIECDITILSNGDYKIIGVILLAVGGDIAR